MSAFYSKVSTLVRVILIATVLFNSCFSNVAFAKSSTQDQSENNGMLDSANLNEHAATYALNLNHMARNNQSVGFQHPSPRVADHNVNDPLAPTTYPRIKCYRGSFHPWTGYQYPCEPDLSSDPSFWEGTIHEQAHYYWEPGSPPISAVHFYTSCPTYVLYCADTYDVYYKVSVRYDWGWPMGGNSSFDMKLSTSMYPFSTAINETAPIQCGPAQSGSCSLEIEGVLNDFPVNELLRFDIDYVDDRDVVGQVIWDVQLSLAPFVDEKSVLSGGCNGECQQSAQANSQGTRLGPINTRTGGLFYQHEDIGVPTASTPLSFLRTYSSLATDLYSSVLGYGWTHNLDTRLIFPDDPGGEEGFVLFKAHTANQYRFTDDNGVFTPAPGVTGDLVHAGSQYTLTYPDGTAYTFDADGRLQTWADAMEHTWQYTYTPGGLLERVSADGGARFLQLDYEDGRIVSVSDQTGRDIEFDYDPNGDLVSMTDVLGEVWRYEYVSHRLTRVLDPLGNTIERTEYDEQGRAVRQYNGANELLGELTYNEDGTTTIEDELGHTVTDQHNDRGVLDSSLDGVGHETKKVYDSSFRPAVITDPAGGSTYLTWSVDGGNLEYIKDALNHETFISYTPSHQPDSIIDPLDYETKYFYAETNFPTLPTRIEYPLSFDGGVTYIGTDYEYYPSSSGASAGKTKFVTDALGNKTFYTYTSLGQTESVTSGYGTPGALTTTYEYDALGRLIKTIDPSDVVTLNEYDAAGQLLKTTHNFVDSRPQNDENKYNIVTEYRYDERNNQIAVIDTYGVITRTYYDTANRPVTTVQNLTGQTIETLLPPARGSVLSNENIRTDTIYDDAGNAIATIDPAGVFSRTYYDEANRPITMVANLTGQDISTPTPPTYSSASPDQNVRTDTVYDLNGNVIATIDTLGTITRTYYDALNRPVTVVQNLAGQTINVTTPPARGSETNIRTDTHYDANGNVIARVDPRGFVTRTYYDALNRPVTVVQNLTGQTIGDPTPPPGGTGATDANIRTDTYYDEAGNVIATIDPRGVITRTYYDESNRPYVTVQNLTGQSIYIITPPARGDGSSDTNVRTDIAYDANGRRDTTTDPRGRVTKYEYNEVGQLVKTTGNYVNDGTPQNEDNQRNIVTAYEYDALGRQVKVTDTLDRVTLSAYDDLGRLLTTTQNKLAGETQNYKDEDGNQYNLITSFTYDVYGNQIAVTDTQGVVTRTYQDMLGRPVTVVRNLVGHDISLLYPPEREDPPSSTANIRTDTIYLGTGAVDYTLDPMGQTTNYSYDDLGRLTAVSDPLAHTTTFAYDANGNRTRVTDAENISTRYEFDNLNRLWAVVENDSTNQPDHETNVRTEYTYDAGGNRLSILDGNDHATSFTYTALGLLETETDALNNTSAYQYNAIGNRRTLLDANGNTTSFEYDELGRLTLIDYPSPDSNVSFNYDSLGRRTSMTDGTGTTTWTYTNVDQPSLITDPFGTGVSYDYDASGNRTELSYNDQTVSYVYNDLNQLSEVSGSGLPDSVQYGYDAAGRIRSVNRPNGVNTSYNYYDNGWLQDITHSLESNPLASYQYQYDGVGNRTHAIENVNGLVIQYPADTPTPTLTFTPTPTSTVTPTVTPTGTPAPEIIHDEFDGPQLGAAWEWHVPVEGPTYSLSAEPDHLQLVVPPDLDHWVDVDFAPQIRRSDMGTGDWAIETYFALDDTNTGDQWQINLMAGFDQYDQQWLSIDSNNILTVMRVGDDESAIEYDINLPIHLRIEKSGTYYTFKYKQNAQDPWTTLDIQTISSAVLYVGLQTRTFYESAGDLVLNMDYFRLERTNQPDPEPVIVHDEFDGSLLGTDWEWYVPAAGPAYSLSAELDSLQLLVPPDKEHWIETDTAPQVRRRDMGAGDWAIETHLALDDSNMGDQWQINLLAGFGRYDQQWLSIDNYNALNVMRVGEGETAAVYEISLPLSLRIEKSGSQYTFKYKENAEDPWATLDTQTITTDVSYVGLQTRSFFSSAGDLVLNVDYFRLERSSQPGPGPEKEIEQDSFDQPTLNSDWTWHAEKEGPTYSLSDVSGVFRMTLPQQDSFEHWIDTDEAPQLQRSDLGTGDWAIEAGLESIDTVDASYWAALHVGFGTFDQIWYGKDDAGGLKTLRVGEGESFAIEGLDLPLSLRLEKHGEEYTFKYRQNTDEAWTVTAPYLFSGTPAYVGLIARSPNTGSEGLQVDWSYFRIERWDAQQGLMAPEQSLIFEDGLRGSILPEQDEPSQPSQPVRTPTPTYAPTKTPTPTLTPSPSDLGMIAPFFSRSEAPVFDAKFVPVSFKLPAPYQQSSSVTIAYEYDPLYRLTEANYSNSDTYHYSYDAVGNRLTQDTQVGGLPITTSYLYDDANRMQSVNGVTYTFDANGNLLNDGINTYTYDSANRLKTLTNATSAASYNYNGLNDRLQETVNGNTTTFTMDLNTGLTQALSDGTNHYIYGVDRIAQVNSATEYFLGDALGSVRQLTDQNGEVTYASAYDPYGVTTSTVGSSQSAYGYTGEFTSNDLVYLRARHYAPGMGRFLTRDIWQGDVNTPLTFNHWAYVEENPVNYTDPSGHYSLSQLDANLGSEQFTYDKKENGLLFSRGWIDKSAFVELLLNASDFDRISIGYPQLISTNPDISYSDYKMLLTSGDCKTIFVGHETLREFYRNRVKKQNQKWLFWRDTSVSYYKLWSWGDTRTFIQGSRTSDLPDYHSIDTSLVLNYLPDKGFWKQIKSRGLVTGIADRYGNIYLAFSFSAIKSISLANYSEGYVCGYYCNPWDVADWPSRLPEASLKRNIRGLCIGYGAQIGVGILPQTCNGYNSIAFSAGAALSAGPVGSLVLDTGFKMPQMEWNSFIDEAFKSRTNIHRLRTDIEHGRYP